MSRDSANARDIFADKTLDITLDKLLDRSMSQTTSSKSQNLNNLVKQNNPRNIDQQAYPSSNSGFPQFDRPSPNNFAHINRAKSIESKNDAFDDLTDMFLQSSSQQNQNNQNNQRYNLNNQPPIPLAKSQPNIGKAYSSPDDIIMLDLDDKGANQQSMNKNERKKHNVAGTSNPTNFDDFLVIDKKAQPPKNNSIINPSPKLPQSNPAKNVLFSDDILVLNDRETKSNNDEIQIIFDKSEDETPAPFADKIIPNFEDNFSRIELLRNTSDGDDICLDISSSEEEERTNEIYIEIDATCEESNPSKQREIPDLISPLTTPRGEIPIHITKVKADSKVSNQQENSTDIFIELDEDDLLKHDEKPITEPETKSIPEEFNFTSFTWPAQTSVPNDDIHLEFSDGSENEDLDTNISTQKKENNNSVVLEDSKINSEVPNVEININLDEIENHDTKHANSVGFPQIPNDFNLKKSLINKTSPKSDLDNSDDIMFSFSDDNNNSQQHGLFKKSSLEPTKARVQSNDEYNNFEPIAIIPSSEQGTDLTSNTDDIDEEIIQDEEFGSYVSLLPPPPIANKTNTQEKDTTTNKKVLLPFEAKLVEKENDGSVEYSSLLPKPIPVVVNSDIEQAKPLIKSFSNPDPNMSDDITISFSDDDYQENIKLREQSIKESKDKFNIISSKIKLEDQHFDDELNLELTDEEEMQHEIKPDSKLKPQQISTPFEFPEFPPIIDSKKALTLEHEDTDEIHLDLDDEEEEAGQTDKSQFEVIAHQEQKEEQHNEIEFPAFPPINGSESFKIEPNDTDEIHLELTGEEETQFEKVDEPKQSIETHSSIEFPAFPTINEVENQLKVDHESTDEIHLVFSDEEEEQDTNSIWKPENKTDIQAEKTLNIDHENSDEIHLELSDDEEEASHKELSGAEQTCETQSSFEFPSFPPVFGSAIQIEPEETDEIHLELTDDEEEEIQHEPKPETNEAELGESDENQLKLDEKEEEHGTISKQVNELQDSFEFPAFPPTNDAEESLKTELGNTDEIHLELTDEEEEEQQSNKSHNTFEFPTFPPTNNAEKSLEIELENTDEIHLELTDDDEEPEEIGDSKCEVKQDTETTNEAQNSFEFPEFPQFNETVSKSKIENTDEIHLELTDEDEEEIHEEKTETKQTNEPQRSIVFPAFPSINENEKASKDEHEDTDEIHLELECKDESDQSNDQHIESDNNEEKKEEAEQNKSISSIVIENNEETKDVMTCDNDIETDKEKEIKGKIEQYLAIEKKPVHFTFIASSKKVDGTHIKFTSPVFKKLNHEQDKKDDILETSPKPNISINNIEDLFGINEELNAYKKDIRALNKHPLKLHRSKKARIETNPSVAAFLEFFFSHQ